MVFKLFNQLKDLNDKYQVGYLKIYEVLRDSNTDEEINDKLEKLKGKEYDKRLDIKIEQIIKSTNSFFDFSIAKEVIVDFPKWITEFDDIWYLVGLAKDKYDLYWIGYNLERDKFMFFTCIGKYDNYERELLSDEENMKINELIDKYFSNNKFEKIIYNSLTGKVY